MGNGEAKEAPRGTRKGVNEEIDDYFTEDTQESNALNRNELMKLTGKELAKLAQPYSTLQLNSLERIAKAKLCDMILAKSDTKKDDEPKARTARTSSQSEQMIDTVLNILDVLKHNRDNEPLNATAKEIFKKQAVVYADEKIDAGEMDTDKASNMFLYLSAGAILFDGIIGFKNAPSLITKVKNKFSKKQSDDTK